MDDGGSVSETTTLGEKISRFRALRGLSLRATAASAGVSSSFLSQVENDLANPSVASLRRIAAALGVSPAVLLESKTGHTRGVLRAADRAQHPLAGAVKYVISEPPLRNLEIYSGTFEPNGSTGDVPYSHGDSQEFLIVVSGTITLRLGDEDYVMHRNDSIEYLSSTPHRIRNESEAPAEVLWITSPPTERITTRTTTRKREQMQET